MSINNVEHIVDNKIYNNIKKPVFCRPYYVAAQTRVVELVRAINQSSKDMLANRHIVRKWAEEICELCDLCEYLTDEDPDDDEE